MIKIHNIKLSKMNIAIGFLLVSAIIGLTWAFIDNMQDLQKSSRMNAVATPPKKTPEAISKLSLAEFLDAVEIDVQSKYPKEVTRNYLFANAKQLSRLTPARATGLNSIKVGDYPFSMYSNLGKGVTFTDDAWYSPIIYINHTNELNKRLSGIIVQVLEEYGITKKDSIKDKYNYTGNGFRCAPIDEYVASDRIQQRISCVKENDINEYAKSVNELYVITPNMYKNADIIEMKRQESSVKTYKTASLRIDNIDDDSDAQRIDKYYQVGNGQWQYFGTFYGGEIESCSLRNTPDRQKAFQDESCQ